MKKINIYNYKEYIPQGLTTLLYKKGNINFDEFITLVNIYMSEEEKQILFRKIKKEEGIDLDRLGIEKETPLFKSVSSNKTDNSVNENIVIVFFIKEKKSILKSKEKKNNNIEKKILPEVKEKKNVNVNSHKGIKNIESQKF